MYLAWQKGLCKCNLRPGDGDITLDYPGGLNLTTVLKSGREGAKELGRGGRNSKQERDSVRCCCGVEDGGRKTTQMQLVTRSWEEPPGDYSSQSYNRNSRILPTLK